MKQIILFLLTIISLSLTAQTIRYRTTGFAYLKKSFVKVSNKWSPAEVLVTVDLSGKKIKIYNEDTESFDIISQDSKMDGTKLVMKCYCLDKSGITCNVFVGKLDDADPPWSIWVQYDNDEYIYKMNTISE